MTCAALRALQEPAGHIQTSRDRQLAGLLAGMKRGWLLS